MPITWDEFFMGVAEIAAKRSKDPNTQVGAVLVDDSHRIVGVGYNGFPRGCEDDEFPWSKEGAAHETKYPYVVHAELNAILNQTLKTGTILYTTLSPCSECAKAIIQAGVRKVVYKVKRESPAVKKMFTAAGVLCTMI